MYFMLFHIYLFTLRLETVGDFLLGVAFSSQAACLALSDLTKTEFRLRLSLELNVATV